MQQVSLTGRMQNVNFNFNAIYSSSNLNNEKNHPHLLLNEKRCSSLNSSSRLSSNKNKFITKSFEETEEMPSRRRRVRNVEQRRKM